MRSTSLHGVQRLFAMFPQGAPGVALVALRASVLASFIAIVIRQPHATSHAFGQAAIALVSLCLAAGLGTPLVSVVAAVPAVADILMGPYWQGFDVRYVLLLDAAALGLLGPGAYSIDAKLFGRRVTVLPAPPDNAAD